MEHSINNDGQYGRPDIASDVTHHSIPAGQDERFSLQLKRASSRYVTVEIPVALTCLTLCLVRTLKSEYIHGRLAEKYNYTVNSSESDCGLNVTSNHSDVIADRIQEETATWLLYLGIVYAIPSIIMGVLLGSISDSLGRKLALILNISGNIAQSIFYLAIVYFGAHVEYLLIADFILGMSGGTALLLSTGAAYVSDVTSEKSRMYRIVALETIFYIGNGIGQVSLGVALQYSKDQSFDKYLAPLWLALGCAAASLLYVTLPNILIETVDGRAGKEGVKLKALVTGIIDIVRVNTNGRRLKVVIYTVEMICIIISAYGQSQLTVVYSLGEPFCYTPIMVAILNITGLAIMCVGMVISGAFLGRVMSEDCILQLSLWNNGLMYLIIALAQVSYQLYIAVGIGVFNSICFPVIRSQLSKLASDNERGLMLAFVGCMDGLGTLLYPVILNNTYSATVSFYPPLVFYFLLAFQLIPSLSICILQCKARRELKYHVIETPDQ